MLSAGREFEEARRSNVALRRASLSGCLADRRATVDSGSRAIRRIARHRELAAAKGGPDPDIPLVRGAVTCLHVRAWGRASTSTARRSGRSSRRDHQVERPGDQEAQLQVHAARRASPSCTAPDSSGTTAVFSDFLTKTSPSWTAKLGGPARSFGKTVAWPVVHRRQGQRRRCRPGEPDRGRDRLPGAPYAISSKLTYANVRTRRARSSRLASRRRAQLRQDVGFRPTSAPA